MGERKSDTFASLDIGSHTTRMLIARKDGTALVPIVTERRVTRLAGNFQQKEEITEAAQQRNIQALKEYVHILDRFGVEKSPAVRRA